MNGPRVSLDQWKVLLAIIDHGSFAQAATTLHRSQSSVSYTIHKLQQQLGIEVLEIHGRKAQLTPAGQALLHHSRRLITDACELEQLARHLDQGWEAEINLVVDRAFPTALLVEALAQFAPHSRGTRVQLREVVLSGVEEALQADQADLAIGAYIPQDRLGDELISIQFIAVAHPQHALHQHHTTLTLEDLRRERQIVIRDSGIHLQRDAGWLGAAQRWTVTSIESAKTLILNGLGFGWLPEHEIKEEMSRGQLRPLALSSGQQRQASLYLMYGHAEQIGPATQTLAATLTRVAQQKLVKNP